RFFDAHTHIDMKHYQHDRDQVIERAKKVGLIGMVTSSMGPGSFRRTLGIVKKYKGYIHHSAGCQASRLTEEEASKTISLIKKYAATIVAVGEVGLDYYWVKDANQRKAQEPLFQMFINLASELNLPLVIHSRKAEARATEILEKNAANDVLMHCYDGPKETTKRIADNGWRITLPANFARYRSRVDAARTLPLEQILLETDGPYLSPTENRNEPANIAYGCESLADLLELPSEDVAKATTKNALAFYRL
ncbi:MAG: TatD family hydrolase, partial [Promethearchaeota archaeon]